jgi:hypothetical protein
VLAFGHPGWCQDLILSLSYAVRQITKTKLAGKGPSRRENEQVPPEGSHVSNRLPFILGAFKEMVKIKLK